MSGEGNDKCSGGGDERNPPVNRLDNPNTVDPPKKRRKNTPEKMSPGDEAVMIDQGNMEIDQAG